MPEEPMLPRLPIPLEPLCGLCAPDDPAPIELWPDKLPLRLELPLWPAMPAEPLRGEELLLAEPCSDEEPEAPLPLPPAELPEREELPGLLEGLPALFCAWRLPARANDARNTANFFIS